MRPFRCLLLACLALLGASGCTTTASPATPPEKLWAIGIAQGSSPLALHHDALKAPRLTWRELPGVSARFVADPFLVRHQGRWLLFFELFNESSKRGEIALAESSDLISWSYKGIVLAEPFHLSYPFVFEFKGDYYMIPESRAAHEVRLYKARSFPTDWNLEKTLIKGDYADSSLALFRGKWWMFTSLPPYTLALFYADSPHGPWRAHPQSPLYPDDSSRARPGGRPLLVDGQLIRFVQDNRKGYGKKLRVMQVDVLTPLAFREHPLKPDPLLEPGGEHWRRNGMHHLSAVQLPSGDWAAAVDGNGDGLGDR